MNTTFLVTLTLAIVALCLVAIFFWYQLERPSPHHKSSPLSVNFHFTRKCNYACGFCFHTAKSSYLLPIDEAKRGLKLLKESGLEKINFAGGEPFFIKKGDYLGQLVQYCKEVLKVPSVSVVTNGSRVNEKWFCIYGRYLDILAISCDSFVEETNIKIGRHERGKHHIKNLYKVRDLCRQYGVLFKLNTVVNAFNYEEDMTSHIGKLNPVRWKIFQCLLLEGENAGPNALRNAKPFWIEQEKFQQFLLQHKGRGFDDIMVPEDNTTMKDSYLILDERMRFLDCSSGRKTPSKSILDIGVNNAKNFSGFDEQMFLRRGGKYKWSKDDVSLDW